MYFTFDRHVVECPGVLYYRRYIDDIFAVLSAESVASAFHHPSLVLDTTVSSTKVVFLDLWIHREGPKLGYSLF